LNFCRSAASQTNAAVSNMHATAAEP
jgi:hypothetical protein